MNNRMYREVSEIENKFNRCRLFLELMNIALYLDSFSISEFCLHQFDILPAVNKRKDYFDY